MMPRMANTVVAPRHNLSDGNGLTCVFNVCKSRNSSLTDIKQKADATIKRVSQRTSLPYAHTTPFDTMNVK